MSAVQPEGPVINPAALEPLFEPWEEPTAHRVRAKKAGGTAQVVNGRRPSRMTVVNNLRHDVREWRDNFYVGASDTTRQLLGHWFERSHRGTTLSGDEFEFRYYFCQREAMETLIYLREVRGIGCLSRLVDEFAGREAHIAALGIPDSEDAWTRYALKMATGSGKTKVMSLAVVWSYFHALRESDSPMARHFVVIAPNLTVYERLKEDFGDGRIFDTDPLIPSEWRGDWNMSIVLQDEASGAATGGVIYLTNIHRLYDPAKRKKEAETYGFMGPPVSRARALDTGAALRERITAHRRIMVLNDEAHHLWDPNSAWNEAIAHLHTAIASRAGAGICAQLDFTATPKDKKGQLFKHIICDTPLGEAVDGGIVKTPIIGRAQQGLSEYPSDNAALRYERHLRLGYERWRKSKEEWQGSGKKALMFVMCEDTAAADQISHRLNTDEVFSDLNGKTINLHTNLKGKVKKVGRGKNAIMQFVENEKEISDDDLAALRKLSRELDDNTSPYLCIVSVLMLREGWDVRNVTTIVPLRPYTSTANILPEQTLGRGLRRITPPGSQGANEIVTCIDHPAFASLYQQELAQEGLPIEIIDVDHIPRTTVTIYPDEGRKDLRALEIELPRLSARHRIRRRLEKLTIEEVKEEFKKFNPLELGAKGATEIDYEGRHMFTNEVIERMEIHLPLLESGIGAVSYYVKMLEDVCKVRGLHHQLAPLVETFLTEVLFDRKADLFEEDLIARLADADVGEHVRAVFVRLIRAKTTAIQERLPEEAPMRLSEWKPYQVTHSERKPVLEAGKTLFNLVPCDRALEAAVTKFLDNAADVAAFAKNAGPQCLRVDYMAGNGRIAFYSPDFFVRSSQGNYYLVETKGREDRDVPRKARAAVAWCKSASEPGVQWEYLYVPQGVFERMSGNDVATLAGACAPPLQQMVEEERLRQEMPLFAGLEVEKNEKAPDYEGFVQQSTLAGLPPRYRDAVEQSVMLFRFLESKEGVSYSPVFIALLGAVEEAAKGQIVRRLQDHVPASVQEQKAWFAPRLDGLPERQSRYYARVAQNLKRTLVFKNGLSALGLLRSCLDYGLNDDTGIGGVFDAVNAAFAREGDTDLLAAVAHMNSFRNTCVAHQQEPLKDPQQASSALKGWIQGLKLVSST